MTKVYFIFIKPKRKTLLEDSFLQYLKKKSNRYYQYRNKKILLVFNDPPSDEIQGLKNLKYSFSATTSEQLSLFSEGTSETLGTHTV
jgi:hypothetical protein